MQLFWSYTFLSSDYVYMHNCKLFSIVFGVLKEATKRRRPLLDNIVITLRMR